MDPLLTLATQPGGDTPLSSHHRVLSEVLKFSKPTHESPPVLRDRIRIRMDVMARHPGFSCLVITLPIYAERRK
jgi:hypothetical protein